MSTARRRCPVAVGRAAETEHVAAVLREADLGTAVVAVSGEAGIGKSRLVEEVLERLDADVTIRRCGCHLADQTLPFGPFIDLAATDRDLQHLAEVLTAAGAGRSSGEGAELRRRHAFDAISSAMLDPSRATVMLVEDLHWADDVSLQALGHLTRRIESTPHRLVVTYRPREQSPALVAFLAELDRRRILDDVEVAPLDADAVAAMAAAITQVELSADQRRRLTELSDGNPFHVEELVRSTGGDVLSADVAIPRTVEHSVTSRLDALDPVTRRAVVRAAIIGRDVPVEQIAALMGWDATETAQRCADLVAAGLLVDVDGERLRFVHELARRAVEGQLLAMERVAIHRELVAFLVERAGGSPSNVDERTRADLARHAYEGRDWPAAIDHGTAAAEAALSRWSSTAALTHLDRVFAAADHAGTELPTQLRLLRAQARRLVGHHADAREDLLAAAVSAEAAAEPGCAWEARYELATLELQDSHERGAVELAVALEAARTWGDPAAIARTLNRQGNLATNRFDFDQAITLLDEAMSFAERSADDGVVAETGVLLLVTHTLRGDPQAGRQAGAAAVERLRRVDDPIGLVHALFSMSMAVAEHAYSDHAHLSTTVSACEAEAREALAIAMSLDWTAGEALSRRAVGGVLAAADQPAEAIAFLRESERQASSIDHLTHTLRAKVMLGDALFDIGDTHGARRVFEEAIELGSPIGAVAPLLPCHLRQVEIDLREGRIDDATERLETVLLRAGDTGLRLAVAAQAQVLAARGQTEEALRLVDDALVDQGDSVPRLGELRGELLARLGRGDEAAAVLRRADRRAAEVGLRQRRRWIVATRARVAAMSGDREEAARLCDEAWAMTEAAAAGLDDDLVSLLRADMERRTSGAPRTAGHLPSGGGGTGSLTRREMEVALVLARGLTNQQIADELFISVRTAETHVKRILSKLGFTSRGQVARWVHDQGLDTA
jgi:DNA-binding CsgD family transcriptional regulator/tetratricopeptide (TPR) repeat protein